MFVERMMKGKGQFEFGSVIRRSGVEMKSKKRSGIFKIYLFIYLFVFFITLKGYWLREKKV